MLRPSEQVYGLWIVFESDSYVHNTILAHDIIAIQLSQ